MTETDKIEPLVKEELKQMSEKYGDKFNSFHEAYAVTLEEVEEVDAPLNEIKIYIKLLWENTKKDTAQNYTKGVFENIKKHSMQAIQELIQVAACCDKALNSFWEIDKE